MNIEYIDQFEWACAWTYNDIMKFKIKHMYLDTLTVLSNIELSTTVEKYL